MMLLKTKITGPPQINIITIFERKFIQSFLKLQGDSKIKQGFRSVALMPT